ncbi:MAG: chlorosome envelope protein B [Chlorobiaceae bacterium]
MSNDQFSDLSAAVNNILQTAGTVPQQVINLATALFDACCSFVTPLGKTATDLASNATAQVTQVFQGAASAVTPKKLS